MLALQNLEDIEKDLGSRIAHENLRENKPDPSALKNVVYVPALVVNTTFLASSGIIPVMVTWCLP